MVEGQALDGRNDHEKVDQAGFFVEENGEEAARTSSLGVIGTRCSKDRLDQFGRDEGTCKRMKELLGAESVLVNHSQCRGRAVRISWLPLGSLVREEEECGFARTPKSGAGLIRIVRTGFRHLNARFKPIRSKAILVRRGRLGTVLGQRQSAGRCLHRHKGGCSEQGLFCFIGLCTGQRRGALLADGPF